VLCDLQRFVDLDAEVKNVLSSLVCPSRSWTAPRFCVRR
jgi:hypothetical protein